MRDRTNWNTQQINRKEACGGFPDIGKDAITFLYEW